MPAMPLLMIWRRTANRSIKATRALARSCQAFEASRQPSCWPGLDLAPSRKDSRVTTAIRGLLLADRSAHTHFIKLFTVRFVLEDEGGAWTRPWTRFGFAAGAPFAEQLRFAAVSHEDIDCLYVRVIAVEIPFHASHGWIAGCHCARRHTDEPCAPGCRLVRVRGCGCTCCQRGVGRLLAGHQGESQWGKQQQDADTKSHDGISRTMDRNPSMACGVILQRRRPAISPFSALRRINSSG